MLLIISDNEIINLDHLIHAEYTPAVEPYDYEDFDEVEGKTITVHSKGRPSRLALTTSELETADHAGMQYDRDILGVASCSVVLTVSGDDADRVWLLLRGAAEKTEHGSVVFSYFPNPDSARK